MSVSAVARYASYYAMWVVLLAAQVSAGKQSTLAASSDGQVIGHTHFAKLSRSMRIDNAFALRADTFLTSLRMSSFDRNAGSGTAPCLMDSICGGRSDPLPCPRWSDTAAAWCQFVHVGGFYYPAGFHGFNRILVASSYVAALSEADEDPHLRVSNDGEHWQPFPGAPDPLFDTSDFTHPSDGQNADLLTDPDILLGADDVVWQFNRPIFKGKGSRWSTGVFVSSSRDLVSWSRPVEIIHDTGQNLISPAPWVDPDGGYLMYTVDSVPGHSIFSGPGMRRGIRLWRAPRADSGWRVIDFVRNNGTDDTLMDGFGLPAGFNPYHVEVVDNGAESRLVLLLCDSLGQAWTRQLFIGETTDNGRHVGIRPEPLLAALDYSPAQDTTRDQATRQWDRYVVYRSTGWWALDREVPVFELYYPGKSDSSNGYWSNKGCLAEAGAQYFIGRTTVEFPQTYTTITIDDISEDDGTLGGHHDSVALSIFGSKGLSSAAIPPYLWHDSTTKVYGEARSRVVHWFTVPDSMVIDSILVSDSSFDASPSDTAYPYVDSVIVFGPDRSSGTNRADSLYFRIHHVHHGVTHEGRLAKQHRWGLREWTPTGGAGDCGQKNLWGHLKPVPFRRGDKVAIVIVTRYNGNHNSDGRNYLIELALKGRKF